jgi:hypothetical protein
MQSKEIEMIANQILNTTQNLIDRGTKPPSDDVQLKTASILGKPSTAKAGGKALAYKIEGENNWYLVALWLVQDGFYHDIIDGECSCDFHGELGTPEFPGDRGVCAHLLTALVLARQDGYVLLEKS